MTGLNYTADKIETLLTQISVAFIILFSKILGTSNFF